jgi:hypothetical protein
MYSWILFHSHNMGVNTIYCRKTTILWPPFGECRYVYDLRSSQQSFWRVLSSGIQCHVVCWKSTDINCALYPRRQNSSRHVCFVLTLFNSRFHFGFHNLLSGEEIHCRMQLLCLLTFITDSIFSLYIVLTELKQTLILLNRKTTASLCN